jgi:hypothetical protein
MRSIPRLSLLAILLAPLSAEASDPVSIYAVPTKVEILPDEATGTRVVIAGSFFFLNAPGGFTYGEPRCGYMSFQCPPGQELMCRMQWRDIRTIGQSYCAGFGTQGMVSSARVYPDRASLGSPDPWDLGMGVSQGQYVDGKCPKARVLNCAVAPPDAGAADTAADTPDGAPPPDQAVDGPPPPDQAVDAPPPDTAVTADAAPLAAADAAVVPKPAKPSGCALGGAGGPLPLGLALLALLRRARR